MKVLVLDAESSVSLAIVRSLAKRGITPICASTTRFSVSFFSKYCGQRIITASPKTEPEEFIKQVIRIIEENNIDVVFPIRGPSTLLIAKYKKEISKHAMVPFEDYEKLREAYDKTSVIGIAEKIGIPVPETYFIKEFHDVERVASEMHYPVVLKVSESEGAVGVKYANNKKELIDKYRELKKRNTDEILLQEYIQGTGYGCSILLNFKSERRAIFSHMRIRENPPTGGPSVARVSVKCPELENLTLKLMKSLGWRGIAMVEFKVTADGKPYLMEVNPRFWGSLPLAIASGVDFPYLLFKMAIDGDVEPVKDYKVGIVARRLLMGDIKVFPHYLMHSGDRLKFIKEFLDFGHKNTVDDIISADDPLPAVGRILWSLLALVGRGGME